LNVSTSSSGLASRTSEGGSQSRTS
jgi:hypothetical protein